MQINVFFKAITMVFLTAVCVATIPAFHYSSMLKGLVGDQLTMRANSTTSALAATSISGSSSLASTSRLASTGGGSQHRRFSRPSPLLRGRSVAGHSNLA